ncbi:MAG: hypothetical protein QOH89_1719, partial [Pseudonocardiales bacterium]|nr:hypothetical protein [Pseudonocardiales bacterium]
MDGPHTEYIQRDGAALAYQVGGSGPHELLMFVEINAHL